MSVLNNKTVIDGLIFNYDINNIKSYVGEPTTNIIPSPTYNAFPTYGNGWGTYNTNQYGSGTYFSIGSISSVASNIVTTSGNHGLRTYDVMQPQTTGGGVTAATNYFIKKLSNTTFSLHEYNSSQDGSQGYINSTTGTYKVHDSLANDTRVSINSTSFPTMWWGYPHLPNSGLVKEIIPNGFNAIPGTLTDCIRLHWHRADGVTDGMSYGVDCSVTPGVPYTVSFWTRAADINAVGKTFIYYYYNYSGGTPVDGSFSVTLGPLNVWQKKSYTFTFVNNVIISYWFCTSTPPFRWDLANIQVEQKSHATAFSLGTRSNTQGLLDLTGTSITNLSAVSYDSGGNISFNYNGYVTVNNYTQSATKLTLSLWTKPNSTTQTTTLLSKWGSSSQSNFSWLLFLNWFASGNLYFLVGNSAGTGYSVHSISHNLSTSSYIHYAVTYDAGNINMYRNGALLYTGTSANTTLKSVNTPLTVAGDWDGGSVDTSTRPYSGEIPLVQIYNKVLTASEVLQNFNATKGRFGL